MNEATPASVVPVTHPANVNVWKNIVYGGVAGFTGSLMTFPIDTAKTRLQEQVKLVPGSKSPFKGGPYTGIFDCIRKMIVAEGIRAPYRGIPVQLIGIIPEKALKLSVNDAMRYKLRSKDGTITLMNETLAGCTAGFLQVVVTSPMEMYKIRMQLQNKKPEAQRQGAVTVAKDIMRGGIRSVYRGAAPTLLRDVTFSAFYFPVYARTKFFLASQDSSHPFWGLFRQANSDHIEETAQRVNLAGAFLAGFGAGSFGAVLVTPFDVIKTRLQSEGGKELYHNIPRCVKITYAEDGLKAFFKGASGRFLLIGPLFGVVLATYELMPNIVPL